MTQPSRLARVLIAALLSVGLLLHVRISAGGSGDPHQQRVSSQEKPSSTAQKDPEALVREFLTERVASREAIDYFLDPSKAHWALYDPELGYRLHSSAVRDGMDRAISFYTYNPGGERRTINWGDRPCRINTYGDSFTQCHQVSDGETWQEYLAAHLGEPVRNFGVGGYGVYQAYRRMLREEATANAAEYVILNVYDDDHQRSLMGCRALLTAGFSGRQGRTAVMYHGSPWAHLRLDPDSGQFQERDGACPTAAALYGLADKEFLYKTFRDDFIVQMAVAAQHGVFARPEEVSKLCRLLDVQGDLSQPSDCRRMAAELRGKAALRSSMFVVDMAADFCRKRNKKLMILLSYSGGNVRAACLGQPRFDQAFVDYLTQKKLLVVDTLQKHVEDFRAFRLSPDEYTKRYYVGHYSPKGNHFFAFAVKDTVVNWLEPKPPAYRQSGTDERRRDAKDAARPSAATKTSRF